MAFIPILISCSVTAVIISVVIGILYAKGVIRIPKNITQTFNSYTTSPSPLPQKHHPQAHNAPGVAPSVSPVVAPVVPPSKIKPSVPQKVVWTGVTVNIKEPIDKAARDCTSHGGIYTGGNNKKFPGCGDHLCCKPSSSNWIEGKSVNVYKWIGKESKAPRECTEHGGVFTGGNNDNFPGCGKKWCCARN